MCYFLPLAKCEHHIYISFERLERCLTNPRSPSFYTRNIETPVQFEEVFAVITLAHKYRIQDIEVQALSFLQHTGYFSSQLHRFQNPNTKKLSVQPAQTIGAVILARLTDTRSMLPGALFRCCALGGGLLDGWSRTDGTAWHLAPGDAKRCVNARATIAHLEWRMFEIVFHVNPSRACAREDKCRAGLHRLRQIILARQPTDRPTLWDWSDDLRKGMVDDLVCECCHQILQGQNRVVLERVWGSLPHIFRLTVEDWPAP